MFWYLIPAASSIALYFWIGWITAPAVEQLRRACAKKEQDYEKLSSENSRLTSENHRLRKELHEIINLYDFNKEICEFLDEENLFSVFRETVTKRMPVKELRFVKNEEEIEGYDDSAVLALDVERKTVGYLVSDGIREKDKERFHVLTHQFLMGVRKAVLYRKVQEMAVTDPLTQAMSRRHFMERFEEEVERSLRFGLNLAYLMIDVDLFKGYNDRYGHLVGDAILKEVSGVIKDNIRQVDFIGRYGGEEFCVVLTETMQEDAYLAAERIRKSLKERKIRAYDENLSVTISVGIAILPQDSSDTSGLIEKADKALYKAKNSGRNKVCLHKE